MESINQWNAKLYDDKLAFVSDYGKGIMELLNLQEGERILDLGCGTGDITKDIFRSGASVVGIDSSKEMLTEARKKYPEITFIHADANLFQTEQPFHAVFSNAALHWIKTPMKVVQSVYNALYPGGRFVAEFGGKDNVRVIVQGILDVLNEEYQVDMVEAENRIPWYFPSVGEYSNLLETVGFRVVYASHFDRPTILPDGDQGMNHWLESFADDFFPNLSFNERTEIYEKIKKRIRPQLFSNGSWIADYKRLRIVATK